MPAATSLSAVTPPLSDSMMIRRNTVSPQRIVGIIPAAGMATRLGELPCSKEVLPVRSGAIKLPVSTWLIKQMAGAGAQQLYFVLRDGKWDIPATFGHGRQFGLQIAYLLMDEPWGPPFTLNQALPFARDAIVMTGFPDILLWPEDAFAQALDKLNQGDAQAVLGTFTAAASDGCDQVQTDRDGRVTAVLPKEASPQWAATSRAWLFAIWRPDFTQFFEQRIASLSEAAKQMPTDSNPEWPVGEILADAIKAGLPIQSIYFDEGQFLDIGEPHRLALADNFPTAR